LILLGNVGIGTSSPSGGAVGGKVLHLVNSGGTASVRVDRSDSTTAGTISLLDANSTHGLYGTGSKPMAFSTNSTEKMRIDSSGAVGIGQVPETARFSGHDILQVGGRATFLGNDTVSSTGQTALLDNLYYDASGNFQHRGDSRGVAMQFVEGQVIFSNSNQTTGTPTVSERMRIDASGNLLVGKSSSSITNTGTTFEAGGRFFTTANGQEAAILNRQTSDGDILLFRKDNTTAVGSIGVVSSNNLKIHSTQSGHSGVSFGTGIVYATDNSGDATNGA